MNKVLGIVQARMNSTRLPGKVMLPLNGTPAIVHIMQRAALCPELAKLYLATSDRAENDVLEALAQQQGWPCYRGSEDDVLSRFVAIVRREQPDIVVRINADNFAIDPAVIAHAIRQVDEQQLDVCTPFVNHTYPFGAGAEVSSAACLLRIDRETGPDAPRMREHIYFYAYEHPDQFSIGYLNAPAPLCRPDITISVDDHSDYVRMQKLYGRFSGMETRFRLPELIQAWDELGLGNRQGRSSAPAANSYQ
jgi:spore coat polysaccharide biosynthesis protein SpsF (cytidylyltransferase family)